ncbi:MAG: hypothetical protein ACTHNZ_01920, partial [Trinickia sp.]|uniref:hypothetical protein n=1 Tax=Trinickia sp. TaxID=2571163 RepID=UPI003F7CD979
SVQRELSVITLAELREAPIGTRRHVGQLDAEKINECAYSGHEPSPRWYSHTAKIVLNSTRCWHRIRSTSIDWSSMTSKP